jgi:hypothetical protein
MNNYKNMYKSAVSKKLHAAIYEPCPRVPGCTTTMLHSSLIQTSITLSSFFEGFFRFLSLLAGSFPFNS